ncbi:MAG: SMI1/KNR4 family protein [Dysgonomonas sp.]|nr:SMI1/KNR4 family protein [Dysgonomonas sp.]
MYDFFFEELNKKSWLISQPLRNPDDILLDLTAAERLKKAPEEFITFIKSFSSCSNIEDTIWFLSYSDYISDMPDDQRWWDEYERQCLESAISDEQTKECNNFWNSYIPFFFAIEDRYAGAVICIDDKNYGKIYHISEPEYEDLSLVANNLEEFLRLFLEDIHQFN